MILVTGASGFIGRSVVHALGPQSIAVSRTPLASPSNKEEQIVCDITDEHCIEEMAAKIRPQKITHIVHAAAITPWSDSPDFSLDLKMAEAICKLCNQLNIPNVYFLSGWIVYDIHAAIPFSENTKILPTTEYGKSKAAVEEYFSKSLDQTKLLNLRLASIFGPGQTSPGLITNFISDAFNKKSITINAKQTRRDYLFIDDFTQAVIKLLGIDMDQRMNLNLGSGKSVSVVEAAQTVKAICKESYGFDVSIETTPYIKEAELMDNRLSIKRAQAMGVLAKSTPFKNGLEAYMDWAKNEDILRS